MSVMPLPLGHTWTNKIQTLQFSNIHP